MNAFSHQIACSCWSCATERARAGARCQCCDGTRQVLAATGEPRPCSRCDGDRFSEWAANLRDGS